MKIFLNPYAAEDGLLSKERASKVFLVFFSALASMKPVCGAHAVVLPKARLHKVCYRKSSAYMHVFGFIFSSWNTHLPTPLLHQPVD